MANPGVKIMPHALWARWILAPSSYRASKEEEKNSQQACFVIKVKGSPTKYSEELFFGADLAGWAVDTLITPLPLYSGFTMTSLCLLSVQIQHWLDGPSVRGSTSHILLRLIGPGLQSRGCNPVLLTVTATTVPFSWSDRPAAGAKLSAKKCLLCRLDHVYICMCNLSRSLAVCQLIVCVTWLCMHRSL